MVHHANAAYKVCRRCLKCAWHSMETHVFQVNAFFRIYLVVRQMNISADFDVVRDRRFSKSAPLEQQSRLLAVLQLECVTARKKEQNRFHQCQMDFSFNPLLLKLLSQTHKCRFPSSSVFEFLFTQLCQKCACLPPLLKKFAKLTNKLPVY